MIVDLLAMIRATGDAQLIQHVEEIKKDLDATEKALESTESSLGVPLKVLEQQRALQTVMAASLQYCVTKLQEMVAQAAALAEEKTVNPEIEARLAAERAKEEAEMDPATLARIREKRAAKEAKKNKKAGKKEKKLNVGNGVQAIQQEIVRLCPSLWV